MARLRFALGMVEPELCSCPARSDRSDRRAVSRNALSAEHGLNHFEAEAKAEGEAQARYSCHDFGVHFAEVRFDPRTGEIRVTCYVSADHAEYHIPVNADIPDTEFVFIAEEAPHIIPGERRASRKSPSSE